MKIGFDFGHNCNFDGGAVGLRAEAEMIVEVGEIVLEQLRSHGHKTIETKPDTATSTLNSLQQRVNKANSSDVDIFVSLHFNCFNGNAYGTEMYAVSDNGRKLASPILKEICKLGFFNRGVKNGSRLFVVKNTQAPAVLIEGCFCDSSRDINLYDKNTMATAIANGLLIGIDNLQKS